MFVQNLSTLLTFGLYLAVVLGIGVIAWRRTHSASDYFLGGRTLSPAVTALSAGASDMSGWVLLGLPGYAYLAGIEAGWISLGLCIGVALNWWLSARRLRIYSHHLNDAVTLPGYLERRFMAPGPWLRLISSVFILLFFLFYVCAGLIGAGKLFVNVLGLSYHQAVVIGAIVVIFYTIFGGFLAVSWTDVFQALLMTVALVVVPLVAITNPVVSLEIVSSEMTPPEMAPPGDNSPGFVSRLENVNPELLDFMTNAQGEPLGILTIISLLGWGLAYFGQPHILARFKAVKSPQMVRMAAGIGISWSLLVYIASIVVGLCGIAYLPEPLVDPEKVFMVMVGVVFHPLIAGFLLAAILAAIMSTVDSQLLVSASTLAEDLYPLKAGSRLNDRQRVKTGRIAVAIIAFIAMIIAMDENSRVLDVVAYAWGGLGAALGPVTLLSLYWRRMNWQGALAGVLTGGITVIVWKQLDGGLFELYELVPGFCLSLLAIVIVSLMTAVPTNSVVTDFDEVERRLSEH